MNFSRVARTGYIYQNAFDLGTQQSFRQFTTNYSTVYNGFGPRVGMDLHYEWGNGLGIYATGALSVLAGSTKASHQYSDWRIPPQGYVYSVNQVKVVPELDTKLGATYIYALAQGDLSLDVGWMWAQYNNALLSGDYYRQTQPQISSFGVQGLYFGMKWVGNIA